MVSAASPSFLFVFHAFLPLTLFSYPSLLLSLCFSSSKASPPSFSLRWWTGQPVGFIPWLLSLWRSQWFFLPLCSALFQRDLILIPSGELQALSCVWAVPQFAIFWFHHTRGWEHLFRKDKKYTIVQWHALHLYIYAQVRVRSLWEMLWTLDFC